MWATNPLVSGTVASQRKPIENEKTSTVFAVIGDAPGEQYSF